MDKPESKHIEEIYENYRRYYGELPEWVAQMGQMAPDALYHYHAMRKIALEDRALPRKVKELILIGINLIRRYPTGIKVHIKGALDAGCTPAEIAEVFVTAMVSGAASSLIEGPSFLAEELAQRGGK